MSGAYSPRPVIRGEITPLFATPISLARRVPRATENQALFMLTGPDGSWRRMCHTMPSDLTCWNFLEVPSMGSYQQ